MAVDFTTPVGQVRALIPDVEEVDFNDDGTATFLFEDEHIEAFLTISGDNVLRAAVRAVEAIAVSEALISKVIKTEDLQTDGAKVANALLARARQLREDADAGDEADDQSAFDIVDFQPLPRILWPR